MLNHATHIFYVKSCYVKIYIYIYPLDLIYLFYIHLT